MSGVIILTVWAFSGVRMQDNGFVLAKHGPIRSLEAVRQIELRLVTLFQDFVENEVLAFLQS
jgi:hypothetical protein